MSNVIDLRDPARTYAPKVEAPAHLRQAAIATWHARMINEYASSRVFTALAQQLAVCGYEEEDRKSVV